MNKDILNKINKIAKDLNINLSVENKDKTLKELGLDSLAVIGVIVKLENELKIHVSDEVLGGIKKFFGIKSPSTVFRDEIGENLALGIGEGFTDEMANVTKDMQNAIPTSFDTDLNVNSGISSNSFSYDAMLDAFKEALSDMKIELDDEVAGKFVERTVARAIYN